VDIFFEQYFDFDVMRDNFDYVLDGFWLTIQLALMSGALSLLWGLVLALLRASPGRAMLPVRGITIAYIDLFRGIPLLLVILLIDGSLPVLDVLPQWLRAPEFLGKPEIYWYGVMAITLTYGAYYAEVYRAGLEAVPYGQVEAARSLGMSHAKAMRHVIVPQAIRKVIPPMLNDFIALMKDTSLVGVIALVEVVKAGREIQAETFNSSALTLGALMFVIVTIPLARLVDRLIARQQMAMRRTAPI
jgi:polar amino acid transport system permease protein